MPSTQHFTFKKGEDVQINWTERLTDSDTAAVVDITGWTFSFKVKRLDSDADPSLITSTTSIVSAVAGTYKTVIAAAQMATLDGDYRHALWRTNAGAQACLSEGFFSVGDTVEA